MKLKQKLIDTFSVDSIADQNERKQTLTQAQFEPSRVMVFDMKGTMAHFRNIQTNSSSLTYQFPPPTTIIGFISAIVGYEWDTYYTIFAPNTFFLSVSIETPIRRIIQTVNYQISDIKQGSNHTLVPIEILVPGTDMDNYLVYRIYFATSDCDTYTRLKTNLELHKSFFPLYMGISEFIADFDYIGEFELEKVDQNLGEIKLSSVLSGKEFLNIDFPTLSDTSFYIEFMRESFYENRVPGNIIKVAYSDKSNIRFKSTPQTIYKVKIPHLDSNQELFISRIV